MNLVCIDASDLDAGLLEQLREADRRITENSGRLNRASMEIAWHAFFIKRYMGWRVLGYEDETHYRQSKRVGRSNWFKLIAIAQGLSHLSREDFLAIATIENAELLAEQPMHVKQDVSLLRKAQTQPSESFAETLAVDAAAREGKRVKDAAVTLKLHVRPGQRRAIEQGLAEWQRAHGIVDAGYALELLLAEFRERLTFVGYISETIMRLSGAVVAARTTEELKQLRDLFATHLQDMSELLKICSGEGSPEEEAA